MMLGERSPFGRALRAEFVPRAPLGGSTAPDPRLASTIGLSDPLQNEASPTLGCCQFLKTSPNGLLGRRPNMEKWNSNDADDADQWGPHRQPWRSLLLFQASRLSARAWPGMMRFMRLHAGATEATMLLCEFYDGFTWALI